MSPRTRKQNEEIRTQRTQEILQAAVRVYVEKGYAASEIGEVAERAGLARGLVYYYFKDKKTLFRTLYQHMMDLSSKFTTAHFGQEGAALELFTNYARFMSKRVLEDPAVPRFYMRISLDVHQLFTPDEINPFEWVKYFMEPMVQAVERGQKQGTIREGDANLMVQQFWGSVSQGMVYLDQLQQQLVSQGIAKQEVMERLQTKLDQAVESCVALLKVE